MPRSCSVDQLLIGAHTSSAGGVHNALLEGKGIGATTVQLFTANQRQWHAKSFKEEEIELFKETLQKTGLRSITSHAGYLINMGSPNQDVRKKSWRAFCEEVERCCALELSFLNFHPGAALDEPRKRCLDLVIEGMLQVKDLLVDDDLRLLLETTAGQGSQVGSSFEELAYIIDNTKDYLPVGVCVDTCHIFAAGYDIRTHKGWQETLDAFDKIIGLDRLCAFHLNDSVQGLGSHKDRHAPLGEGEIGWECFKFLMTSPKTRMIPKYLETPGGPPLWDKEIWKLREFARGSK